MPRPQTLSDDEILVLATRAVRRHGPRVTLAQIAAMVGLSSARLVQRFGSRLELLAAVEASVDSRLQRAFVRGAEGHDSPLKGLIESLAALAERSAKRLYLLSSSYVFDPRHLDAPDGASAANHRMRDFETEVRRLLQRAADAGELSCPDPKSLARTVFVTWIGSYNLWAYAPIGRVGDTVRRDLEAIFEPWRPARRPAKRHNRR